MKTLTRQDAYDAANWENVANAAEVQCFFEENGDTYRAFIKAEDLSHVAKKEDLELMIKAAIAAAKPIPIMSPIAGSFMQMSSREPPIYDRVKELFHFDMSHTIFTFGDVLHNPHGVDIAEDYIRHEEIHAAQQGHTAEGAGEWYARYFQDPYFRVDQEARAFAAQYDWWCKQKGNKDRNLRNRKMIDLAIRLSAPTYGSVVNPQGARKLIESFCKIKR